MLLRRGDLASSGGPYDPPYHLGDNTSSLYGVLTKFKLTIFFDELSLEDEVDVFVVFSNASFSEGIGILISMKIKMVPLSLCS